MPRIKSFSFQLRTEHEKKTEESRREKKLKQMAKGYKSVSAFMRELIDCHENEEIRKTLKGLQV